MFGDGYGCGVKFVGVAIYNSIVGMCFVRDCVCKLLVEVSGFLYVCDCCFVLEFDGGVWRVLGVFVFKAC